MSNRALHRLLFSALLFFIAVPAFCQEFPMLHFTTEDGLPSNNIYQVYKDGKGFLWFGTDKGAARYDGVKFEVFTTFNGLPDNEVVSFKEDKYGRLWLGTFNGELCYYKDDTFHNAGNTPFLRLPIKSSHILMMSLQKDSSMVVVFSNSSIFLNIHHNQCDVINISRLTQNGAYGPLIYRQKITSNRYRLVFANTTLIADTNAQIKQQFSMDTLNVTSARSESRGFVFCQDEEYLFNNKNIYTPDMRVVQQFPPHFHEQNYVQGIYINNYTFYATNNGLFVNDTIHLLKDQNVSSVTSDTYGNFWISTLSGGIYELRANFYGMMSFKNAYDGKIKYCCAQKGHLFFATANNNLYHIANGKLNCLLNYASIKQRNYSIPVEPGYLIDDNYAYYNFYNHDYLTMDNVFSGKNKVRYHDLYDGIKTVIRINDYIYIRRRNEILRIKNSKDDKTIKPQLIGIPTQGERIFGFAKDNENNIWYATVNSVYKITDTITTLQPQFRKMSFKSFEFLGNRLIGYTHDNQLFVCSNISSNITIDSVQTQDCIWDKFYPIDDYHMLISTNNYYRLLTVDEANNSRNFKVSIIRDPFIPNPADAVCLDKTNCYFFKNGQVTSMDINSLLVPAPAPRLYFTTLKTGSQSCIIHDQVIIPFAESKNINISFATVAHSNAKVFYQYSVSKNNRDNWVDINGEDISLINSGFGSYKIKIRARTVSSDYCKPVEFTLFIRRPFWATWWFIAFCICLIAIIVVVISRQRLIRALKKKDKEHANQVRFLKSEYKALNALMNPHFVFNTLNNVQGLINKNDKLAANEYLRIIADLIRQNMHNISKELIPLQKEIDLVNNYLLLEKLRFKDKLNYSIIIEKDLDLSDIMVPPLLIQPLVENSIKHGILPLQSSEGAIYINIYQRKNILHIEVRDNGIGIDQAKQHAKSSHESFGLENIRKRIEQLSIIQNKQITFDFSERKNTSGKLQWTIVTITMPI